MEIFINNQKADITLDNERTLREVLSALETEFSKHDATTVTIFVNGNAVTADEFEKYSDLAIEDVNKLELTTVSQEDIKNSFIEIGNIFSILVEDLKQIALQFQSGQDSNAVNTVKKLADSIDMFCHVATLSSLFPEKFDSIQIDGKSISEFFDDFSSVLTEFEQALQNSDSVLVGDLAEYEISPRLISITEMTQSLK